MNITKRQFVAGIKKRAAELRALGLLGVQPAGPEIRTRGRQPKPVDFKLDDGKDDLIDAFDASEDPLEEEESADL